MSSPRCPTCDKRVGAASENAAFPFCCARCKLIDLGNWLDERYRVAGERLEPAGEEDDPMDQPS